MSRVAALSGSQLTVDVLRDAEAFTRLETDWKRLESLDDECTPFNTWHWNATWWDHYANGASIWLIVVRRLDRIIGILPLYRRFEREHRVFQRQVVRLVGSGGDTSPDFLNLIAEPHEREAVVEAALDRLFEDPSWQTLQLSDVAEGNALDSGLRRRLSKAPGHGGMTRQLVLVSDLPARWEDFVAGLSRKRRKQLNHRRNRLEAAGDARLARALTVEQRREATDALIDLHRARWVRKGEAGGFASDAYESFHRTIIEAFAADGSLWLVTLTLDERIVGVLYAFEWRHELMLFQSGLSPEHESLSPGHVLFGWAVRKAIASGCNRLNLLKGDYHYKTAWARKQTWTITHVYRKPGTSAWLSSVRGRLAAASPGAATLRNDKTLDAPIRQCTR